MNLLRGSNKSKLLLPARKWKIVQRMFLISERPEYSNTPTLQAAQLLDPSRRTKLEPLILVVTPALLFPHKRVIKGLYHAKSSGDGYIRRPNLTPHPKIWKEKGTLLGVKILRWFKWPDN
jgi:hypothetical protein